MEDQYSSQSLSSCSTLSSVQSLSGADLDAVSNAVNGGSVNPYALFARRRAGPAVRTNRRFPRFFNDHTESDSGSHHFLDSCFLCKKPLAGNRDIFMYRGDMPFCSEECRQAQIEADEAKENKNSVSLRASSRKELQKNEQKKQQSSILAG